MSDEMILSPREYSSEEYSTARYTGAGDYEEVVGSCTDSVNSISDMATSIGRSMDQAANLANLYKECVLAEERTKQIEAWGQVEIARTVAKFKTAQDFMEKTFGERDRALTKFYDRLDDAVATGDREMILASLHGISSIVTKSPLDDFEKFIELYNDTSQPLLDF